MAFICVAIDGPSGSGKSTAARRAANRLGFAYVDTGAMYRAIAFYALNRGIDFYDRESVVSILSEIKIEFATSDGSQRLFLNGEDVSGSLRTQEIAAGSSIVAEYPEVRRKLTALQREIASKGDSVLDGRDIGSVVLPDAALKIYMDASVETRTKRRVGELKTKGLPCEYETVRREIRERDLRDAARSEAPLIRVSDAVYLSTDGLDEIQAAEAVIDLIKTRCGR